MDKTFDNSVGDFIDLGSVSEETRGGTQGRDDSLGGLKPGNGLTND